ncbi:MAG: tRNA guanosine(34) transglycosylase Tgt [Phycisphaerales bacterium]
MGALLFEVVGRGPVGGASPHARVGRVVTRHGVFETPAYMPVGTQATVKGLLPMLVAGTGSQVCLANTYHLLLRPGPDLIERRGGLHPFMGWDRPILTDSGGYQVYSMADINKITDEGVRFRSVIDGSMVELTPERAIETQNKLGADIIMAFDDCPPSVDPKTLNETRRRLLEQRVAQGERKWGAESVGKRGDPLQGVEDFGKRLDLSMERTARWLERCKAAHARSEEQALFGIIQGATDLERRTRCVEMVCSVELPGYAIGGVAVGEGADDIRRVVEHTAPLMPQDKPRYLMGVGYEKDMVSAARAGVDMFDCVLPTRNGRNANAFTPSGQIRLRNARFAEDDGAIDASCDCVACCPGAHGWATPDGRPFSRAYLRHLFMAEEMLGAILVSLHNIRHFQRLMADVRATIPTDEWDDFYGRWPVARPGASVRAEGGACGVGGDEMGV